MVKAGSQRLAGKIACITGAASGIGRATAIMLAREGARVVATDMQAGKGQQLVAEIGGDAHFITHDVTREEDWQRVIADVKAAHGRLDVLVNNAGIGLSGPVTEMSLADWRRQTAVNLDGVFLGVKYALPLMRETGGGSIINMSSIAAMKPSMNVSGYCATKAAVRQFTKVVALECAAAKDGIRVNSLHPGIVETQIWDSLIGTGEAETSARPRKATLDGFAARSVPFGRPGEPDEIAAAVVFLASDESRYMTGAEMVIDGGRSIG